MFSSHKFIRRAGFLLSLILISACDKPATSSKIEFRVPVTAEKVSLATFEDKVITTGTLRASEIISLTVMSSGLLEILDHKNGRYAEGDHVNQGQQIALITGEDVRLAARRSTAQQQLRTERKNLDALLALFKKGRITDTDLGRQRVVFEEAKLEYDRAVHTEDRNRIITPIEGVIVKLARDEKGQLLANGQLVSRGQMIAQVAAMDKLVANVDLVGKDIAKIGIGVLARAQYYAWGEKTFEGKVLRLAPTVDEKTRALHAEVEINNTDGLLRPGMFVEVSLIKKIHVNVPRVPRRSLVVRGGKQVVFLLEGQRVRQQEVKVGLADDEWVEIRNGVSEGDSVVVSGLETLTDQMPVRVSGL